MGAETCSILRSLQCTEGMIGELQYGEGLLYSNRIMYIYSSRQNDEVLTLSCGSSSTHPMLRWPSPLHCHLHCWYYFLPPLPWQPTITTTIYSTTTTTVLGLLFQEEHLMVVGCMTQPPHNLSQPSRYQNPISYKEMQFIGISQYVYHSLQNQ